VPGLGLEHHEIQRASKSTATTSAGVSAKARMKRFADFHWAQWVTPRKDTQEPVAAAPDAP